MIISSELTWIDLLRGARHRKVPEYRYQLLQPSPAKEERKINQRAINLSRLTINSRVEPRKGSTHENNTLMILHLLLWDNGPGERSVTGQIIIIIMTTMAACSDCGATVPVRVIAWPLDPSCICRRLQTTTASLTNRDRENILHVDPSVFTIYLFLRRHLSWIFIGRVSF